MVAAALAIGASSVVGGVAASKAAGAQSKAAKSSAAASSKAATADTKLQWDMYQQQRQDFDKYAGQARQQLNTNYKVASDTIRPYQRYGGAATNKLAALAGVNGTAAQTLALQNDPGYQFRMNQGVQALDRSAAARGMLLSGAQTKALTGYGQGLASEELGNAFNRVQSVQSGAQSAAGTQAGLYSNRGTALANIATGQGSNLGQLTTGTTNALTNISQNNAQNQVAANTALGQARGSAYTGAANAVNSGVSNGLFLYGMQNGMFGNKAAGGMQ